MHAPVIAGQLAGVKRRPNARKPPLPSPNSRYSPFNPQLRANPWPCDSRLLTPEELGQLGKRMVEAKDPAEADRLQEQIERGFYGVPPRA